VHRFSVWAPGCGRVDLIWKERAIPMEGSAPGWWALTLDDAGPGDRYGYQLDGGPVRPDPRSCCQPDGVEGLSEVVDHGAFVWSDREWRGVHLAGAVLYELHVGTFTPQGTFDAVADRLHFLADLGVDAIELLPVASFPGRRGWGYDGVCLYAPHATYGGPEGLRRLVDRAHQAGIGVVLDVVYNHLGPSGNFLPEFGPYFSSSHRTNWGKGINLDGPGSDDVRRYLIDNALMWMRDYHVDGLRLDAVHALSDSSAVHFLEQLNAEIGDLAASECRPLFAVGECDLNDPRYIRTRDAHGYGLDATWADEWHHALHAYLTGERDGYYSDFGSLDALGKAIRQAWVYDGMWSRHRARTFGRPPVGIDAHRFVVFTQNHDQVGNRAVGERTAALTSIGRLKVAAALLLTSPFVPLLFMGEEWAASTPWQYFTDFDDPDLGRAVSEGRRAEFSQFGWSPEQVPDPQDPGTFERSKLDWSELDRWPHLDVLNWYRDLIRLRRETPDLTDGRRGDVEVCDKFGGLRLRRGRVEIIVNLGHRDWEVPVATGARVVLASGDVTMSNSSSTLTVTSDSAVVMFTAPSMGRQHIVGASSPP
jgi:maltooligosyltrehalose trehalohydrolase